VSELVSAANVSAAWIRTLEAARAAPGGRRAHLVTAVADPGHEIQGVRHALDTALTARGLWSIDTVAETIFPTSLYRDPHYTWTPASTPAETKQLDDAAAELYDTYLDILPLLRTMRANKQGTYFSRMITWPGKEAGGTNQLALRVKRLRSEARLNHRTLNTLDIDVAADALAAEEPPIEGVQVYAVSDVRTRSFPCLTHIDLTLLNGELHCTAVYRHQYLVEKAYGNLVGLANLMRFLAQQGGCAVGELVVHATLADSQPRVFPGGLQPLLDAVNLALSEATRSV
jgi:hypothetical protein